MTAIADLMTTPVVVVHRQPSGTTDEYGNDVPTETETETVGEIQQRQRSETAQGIAAEAFALYLPAGTTIAAGDDVLVAGERYTVEGAPWHATNPLGGEGSHVEATLTRSESTGGSDAP